MNKRLLGSVLVLVLVLAGVWYFTNNPVSDNSQVVTSGVDTSDWKTYAYKNNDTSFSFSYPASFGQPEKVSNYSGSMDSILFKDGFSISIGVGFNPISERNFTIAEIVDGYKESEYLKDVNK